MSSSADESSVSGPGEGALLASISPIGGLRNATLELKGTILVYHQRAWSGRLSIFIPVEGVGVSRYQRLDSRSFMRVIVAPVLMLLLLAPVMRVLDPYFGDSASLVGALVVLALLFVMGIAVLLGLVTMRRRGVTEISIDVPPTPLRINFWHTEGADRSLDSLVERLEQLREHADEEIAYPIRKSHTWYHVNPFRAAVVKSLFVTLALVLPMQVIAYVFEMPRAMGLLSLPTAFYMGRYSLEQYLLRFAPVGFREALRSYQRDRFVEAESHLGKLLEVYPEHTEACLLSIQLSLERNDFTTAFMRCRQVAKNDPELADDIMEEIWVFKRMHDRMGLAG